MEIARPLSQESTMIEFEGKAKSPLNAILIYLGLFLAVAFTVFILMSERSVQAQLETAKDEQIGVREELNKPAYADVIGESKAFETAVNSLSVLSAKKMSKAEILTEFYKYITKDVRINGFSISDEGVLAIDGVTGSYRSVADFVVGLQSFERASDVTLISVSMNSGEDVSEKERFSFNVAAKLNMEKIEKVEPVIEEDTGETTTDETTVVPDNSDIIEPDSTTNSIVDDSSSVVTPNASDISTEANSYEGF